MDCTVEKRRRPVGGNWAYAQPWRVVCPECAQHIKGKDFHSPPPGFSFHTVFHTRKQAKDALHAHYVEVHGGPRKA